MNVFVLFKQQKILIRCPKQNILRVLLFSIFKKQKKQAKKNKRKTSIFLCLCRKCKSY